MPILKENVILKYISKRNFFTFHHSVVFLVHHSSRNVLSACQVPITLHLVTPPISSGAYLCPQPYPPLSPQPLLPLVTMWFQGNCLHLCIPKWACDPELSKMSIYPSCHTHWFMDEQETQSKQIKPRVGFGVKDHEMLKELTT